MVPERSQEPLPLRHPAFLIVIIAAAISLLLSTSQAIFDPDLYQHLLTGKVIWQEKSVPLRHLWTWANYGSPQVLPSWLFRVVLWPFWEHGGVIGLFVFRWMTTLTVFGLVWAAARRIGARGLISLVVISLCGLIYRGRVQIRPEMLVSVLLAAQVLLLETRRHGGRDFSIWIVLIALVWINTHISYHIGIFITGVFWIDALISARSRHAPKGTEEGPSRRARQLGYVLLASIAVSFVNPFGWRALWEPFAYFLYWRNEPIYRSIAELGPIEWSQHLSDGLPLLFAGWPLLLVWRSLQRRFDRVEVVLCLFFSGIAWMSQRFLGVYAIVAGVYVSRDLAEWFGNRRWTSQVPHGWKAGLAAASCLAIGIPTWTTPGEYRGLRTVDVFYARDACDFMEEHGIRGRGFNSYELAGYQLYRFWPDRERLPFMDIHQTGTTADRLDATRMFIDPAAWKALDQRYDFDYVLLSRNYVGGNAGLNALDADTAFALVFLSDVSALYVRREQTFSKVIDRFGYDLLPAGDGRIAALQRMCSTDSLGCSELEAELRRAARSTPRHGDAMSLLANISLMRGRYEVARSQLTDALRAKPLLLRGHERLGMLDLTEGRAKDALDQFRKEWKLHGAIPGLAFHTGQAYRHLGDRSKAERQYRIELAHFPGNREAADSLAALQQR